MHQDRTYATALKLTEEGWTHDFLWRVHQQVPEQDEMVIFNRSQTDVDYASWHTIPADVKTHRNLAIASIVLETIEGMKLVFPPGDPELMKLK